MDRQCICGKPRRIGAQNKVNATCGNITCMYASRNGQQRVARIEFVCEQCGKLEMLKPGNARGKRFCSKACTDIWQQRFKFTVQCGHCDKVIVNGKNSKREYCSFRCAVLSGRVRKNAMKANLALQHRKDPTRPEQFLYDWLTVNNIPYQPQHKIEHWIVDAYIPGSKTIIQVDGDYWHGNPVLFPEPDARVRKRMGIDRSQEIWFNKMGYNTIRIWESDIYDNIDRILREVTGTFTEKI